MAAFRIFIADDHEVVRKVYARCCRPTLIIKFVARPLMDAKQ